MTEGQSVTVLEREAIIRWLTSPPEGQARMTVGGGSLGSVPLSLDPSAAHPLATSPGELLAGAIGGSFAFFVAEELAKEGVHARELSAHVTLTVSDNGSGVKQLALSGVACRLLGRVPQIDQERFDAAAAAAMRSCLKTLCLRTEVLMVTVEAVLESA